jgi:hypothetical protein
MIMVKSNKIGKWTILDLRGVEDKLNKIASELRKLFRGINEKEKHKEIIKIQQGLKWATWVTAGATVLLFIITCLLFLSTLQALEFQENLYAPRIDVKIATSDFELKYCLWGDIHKVGELYLKELKLPLLLKVEITNIGIIPFHLDVIHFSGCGIKKKVLIFSDNLSKDFEIGETRIFSEEILLSFNETVEKSLPCYLDFTIYGINLIKNKRLKLVK